MKRITRRKFLRTVTSKATTQRPKVLREHYPSCGTCEYKCRIQGGVEIRADALDREARL